MKQKLLSLLVLLMAVTGAWAQGPWDSGDCTVTLSDGVLKVSKKSGTGAMADYARANDRGWNAARYSITSVVVEAGVTHIGNQAFRTLTNVTSVTLPATLLTIGNDAFSGDNNVGFTSVTIPASVTSIGQSAFANCNKLTSATIAAGSNLTTIGNNAFYRCSALGSINIPASVTSIGYNSFQGCSALATVTIADGSNLTTIDDYTFQDCSTLGSITIPAGVTSIGKYAFYSCSTLGSITIPASVTSIGQYAFKLCSNLATVTFSDGSNLTSIGNNGFQNCSTLGSITIPASVTSIGNNAFQDCTNLATVTFNSNPSIGSNAFTDGTTVTMNLTANSAGGANWTTFYNQNYGFEADAKTEVFKVALSGIELTLNKVDNGIVDAGTAVVLKTTDGNPVMTLTTTASGDTQDNSLTGVSAVAGLTASDPSTTYVLSYTAAHGVGFYRLKAGKTLGLGKAYLTYSGGGGAPQRDFFEFVQSEETTGIEALKDSKTEEWKADDVWYTLQGAQLDGKPTEKGIYVVNGKKVFIK